MLCLIEHQLAQQRLVMLVGRTPQRCRHRQQLHLDGVGGLSWFRLLPVSLGGPGCEQVCLRDLGGVATHLEPHHLAIRSRGADAALQLRAATRAIPRPVVDCASGLLGAGSLGLKSRTST
jgi:hypothetical protein